MRACPRSRCPVLQHGGMKLTGERPQGSVRQSDDGVFPFKKRSVSSTHSAFVGTHTGKSLPLLLVYVWHQAVVTGSQAVTPWYFPMS